MNSVAKAIEGNAMKEMGKGAVTQAAKEVTKGATKQVTKEAAKGATKQATKEAAKGAVKQAAKEGMGATIGRVLGVVTLVLVPFDIAKLVKDFGKSRQSLADTIRARYQADRPLYDVRIFDALWPTGELALSTVLQDARASLYSSKGEHAQLIHSAQEASALHRALHDLSGRLTERANG